MRKDICKDAAFALTALVTMFPIMAVSIVDSSFGDIADSSSSIKESLHSAKTVFIDMGVVCVLLSLLSF